MMVICPNGHGHLQPPHLWDKANEDVLVLLARLLTWSREQSDRNLRKSVPTALRDACCAP